MKRIILVSLVCIMAGFMAVGCENTDEEIEAIKQWVLEDTTYFDASTPEDTAPDQSTLAMMPMAIDTVDSAFYWWRGKQTSDTTDIEVDVVDDSGWVEWTRHHAAALNVFAFDSDSANWVHWAKDYDETTRIRGIFRKTGTDADPYMGWTLERISCAVGSSDNSSVSIDSIKLLTQTDEILLQAPFEEEFFHVDSLVKFKSLEQISITLYANDEETVAHLHTILLWPVRDTFSNAGGGVHEGTWNAQLWESLRYAIFDLMKASSLYEQDGEYDYDGVLLPYVISNE
ncbi:hypothetical protein GF359_03455 [candidate division WOR-3 bacterium]|uniref:Lipoprotein n=1 Tax=candidate division WOR-3 bacterium TaxID=2052148 RepID=A0A9D5KAH0_UNCW3|nr:hypothetical protein [candidate division WOR-3 bacterium]MBD3364251.1 hypothetical protein [candidate division WOR-3 bacterium]